MLDKIFDIVGMITAVILPLFNIPLILRIIKRQSSEDISLVWAVGVWVGILLMAPSAIKSHDAVWKTFTYMNMVLFTAVFVITLRYRKRKSLK